jgi:hypothetical protein
VVVGVMEREDRILVVIMLAFTAIIAFCIGEVVGYSQACHTSYTITEMANSTGPLEFCK